MMSHRVLVLSLGLLAVGGGGAYVAFSPSHGGVVAQEAVTVAVTRETLSEMVTAQGTLEPKNYVDVGVQVSGQLKKLHGEIGDKVKAGDLVAELDPAPYQTRVAADEAKLGSLQAQLAQKKAERDLNEILANRAAALIKIHAISQEEMDTRSATLKISEAAIKSLEAQSSEALANLENDKINLGYTKIYAPMDGIIADQTAREGQTLNANQTTPKILQIADLSIMTVRAQVAEADVMRLKPDMDARFSTLGAMEKQWKGRIRQILPTPEVINDVVLYNVLIDVENKNDELMNGMSTQVFFETARADNVLTLPIKALGRRNPAADTAQGKAYDVTVATTLANEKKTVLTGLMTRQQVEIVQGLQEGEKIVMPETSGESSGGAKEKTNGSKRAMPPSMGPRL